MENNFPPITPPPELFKKWEDDILNERDNVDHVLDRAWRNGFQAGADQELEACCEWLEQNCGRWDLPAALRDARRPEPPSLKGKALDELQFSFSRGYLKKEAAETIRRALESLPD